MNYTVSLPKENAINLRRLLWMRMALLPGVALAVWLAGNYLHAELPLHSIAVVLVCMALVGVATMLRLRGPWPVSKQELFSQLVFDVVVFTILLYLTGGSTNPFAPAYLLPLAMTVVALPGIYVWAMFALTTTCYTFLLFNFIPLPMAHSHGFQVHIWGMWVGFLFSAGLFAGFAARVAATVRERDRSIAQMREQQARNEKVIALGTLAAGAAHELGTPLSTMAVILKDVQAGESIPDNSLTILKNQLRRCKEILLSLSVAAGDLRAESGRKMQVSEYMAGLLDQWRDLHPGLVVQVHTSGVAPGTTIVVDRTLDQAILNILNNAADASLADVEVDTHWSDETLLIEVRDRGPGLHKELVDAAGKIIVSTKQEGLGVGLYLSYNTLERMGGDIRLFNRDGGGAVCRIRLPLANIRADQ